MIFNTLAVTASVVGLVMLFRLSWTIGDIPKQNLGGRDLAFMGILVLISGMMATWGLLYLQIIPTIQVPGI